MPKIDRYTFDLKELLELMVKAAELHEGKWVLQANFGFSASNLGPDDDNLKPGALVLLNYLAIAEATSDAPSSLVVDAAEVNPRLAAD